jgi:hypothetical protein
MINIRKYTDSSAQNVQVESHANYRNGLACSMSVRHARRGGSHSPSTPVGTSISVTVKAGDVIPFRNKRVLTSYFAERDVGKELLPGLLGSQDGLAKLRIFGNKSQSDILQSLLATPTLIPTPNDRRR